MTIPSLGGKWAATCLQEFSVGKGPEKQQWEVNMDIIPSKKGPFDMLF